MSNKEYDDFYETGEWGFKFIYKNNRIGKSIAMSKSESESIPIVAMNLDRIVIFCKKCNRYMDYVGDGFILDDYYICKKCGKKVKEKTPYDHLEKENQQFIDGLKVYEDDEYSYEDIY